MSVWWSLQLLTAKGLSQSVCKQFCIIHTNSEEILKSPQRRKG